MDPRSLKLATTLTIAFVSAYASISGIAKVPMEPKEDKSFEKWENKPKEPFSEGKKNFETILNALKTKYIKKGASEDDLYRAAAQGLLNHTDPGHETWDKLLTPAEYAELKMDLDGEISGVGLGIQFDSQSGMGVVIDIVPDTPAQKAGLRRGDHILRVDGQSYAGKQIRDIVYAIRGKVGTEVALTMLRDVKVFTTKLTRSSLNWDEVAASMLDTSTALVSISSFTKQTAQKMKNALAKLPTKNLRGLIVDLRSCSGGSFEAAVATTALMLPKGSPIVRVQGRDGTEQVKSADGTPLFQALPLSILISEETASGCEMMAAALKQNLKGTLVGSRSFGKWNMQSIEELPNHYAMKFTIANFFPPDRQDFSGKGIMPDLPVTLDSEEIHKLQRIPLAERMAQDVQLRAARHVLNL